MRDRPKGINWWDIAVYVMLFIALAWALSNQRTINKIERSQRTVVQRIDQQSPGSLCTKDDVKTCRVLIDRLAEAATAKQEHALAVRLFRSLTAEEIRQLGLRGPQGPRGRRGEIRTIHETRTVIKRVPGKTTVVTKTVVVPPPAGQQGAGNGPAPQGPSPVPPAQSTQPQSPPPHKPPPVKKPKPPKLPGPPVLPPPAKPPDLPAVPSVPVCPPVSQRC